MTTFTFADHSRSVSLKSSRRTFGQGRVPAPLTAESEGAVAPTGARRQIKHGGCPWSDTWSHFKARERHWSAVISSERQSVRLKVRGGKTKHLHPSPIWRKLNVPSPQCHPSWPWSNENNDFFTIAKSLNSYLPVQAHPICTFLHGLREKNLRNFCTATAEIIRIQLCLDLSKTKPSCELG